MKQEEYNSTTAKKNSETIKLSLRYKTLLLFSPDERNKIPVSLTTPKEDIFIKENRCLSRITKGDRGFSGSGCWMVQESRILPWTVITELAATGAAACAAKLRGKVLGGNLPQEFCLITPTQNIDFVDLNSENSQPQTGRAFVEKGSITVTGSKNFLTTLKALEKPHGELMIYSLPNLIFGLARVPAKQGWLETLVPLWVVVLRDCRDLFNKAVHGTYASNTHTLKVHDGAAGLEKLAGLS